jgi:uncharacterized membrane protein
MFLTPRNSLIAISAISALAMLYVGAYQIRAVEHLSCPIFKHSCEAVADAPFARPFGIPDGFLAAGMYAIVIVLALFPPEKSLLYAIRALAIFAALANGLGVFDMKRLGAYCFYCLLTTILSPVLIWLAFLY